MSLLAVQLTSDSSPAGAPGRELLRSVESAFSDHGAWFELRRDVSPEHVKVFVTLLKQFERFSTEESWSMADRHVEQSVRNYARAAAGWADHLLAESAGKRRFVATLEFWASLLEDRAAAVIQ